MAQWSEDADQRTAAQPFDLAGVDLLQARDERKGHGLEALAAALLTRKPPHGVIFHSDRGCQYTSREFADFCAENGVTRSMGRRATCFDNAVSESFFATYKKELIHTRPWNDLTEVRQHTFLWIEGYYNRRRRHSTLDYLTPLEYELGFRKLTDLAA